MGALLGRRLFPRERLVELRIWAASTNQLAMLTLFDDRAIIDDDN